MRNRIRYGMSVLVLCALTMVIASACAARGGSATQPQKPTPPEYTHGHNRECKTRLPSVELAKGAFRTFKYDIDVELDRDKGNDKHPAICLSSGGPSGPDSITWLRSSKKKFTIRYIPQPKDGQSCPENPFDQPLPDATFAYLRVDTGSPKSDVRDCLYQVEITPSDGAAADPHIIINK